MILCLLGMAIISCCIVGLLSSYSLFTGYQELSCSATVILDDAIHGSPQTQKHNHFAGTSAIISQMSQLRDNSTSIYATFSQLSTNQAYYTDSMDLFAKGVQAVSVIPTPTGASFSLHYPTPLLSSTPTDRVSSTFPKILGSKGNSSSLVGTANSGLQKEADAVTALGASVDAFIGTQGKHAATSNQIIDDMKVADKSRFQSLLLTNDILNSVSIPSQTQNVELLVYGSILTMVSLLLLSQLCFLKCMVMGCRHCIYLLGCGLFFATLLAFALWLLLGLSTAISYSGCNYLAKAVSDPDTFTRKIPRMQEPSRN